VHNRNRFIKWGWSSEVHNNGVSVVHLSKHQPVMHATLVRYAEFGQLYINDQTPGTFVPRKRSTHLCTNCVEPNKEEDPYVRDVRMEFKK